MLIRYSFVILLLAQCCLAADPAAESDRTALIANEIRVVGSVPENSSPLVIPQNVQLADGFNDAFNRVVVPVVQQSGYGSAQDTNSFIARQSAPEETAINSNSYGSVASGYGSANSAPANTNAYASDASYSAPSKPKRIRIIPQKWRSIPYQFDIRMTNGLSLALPVVRGTDSMCDEDHPLRLTVVIHSKSQREADFNAVLSYLGRMVAYLPQGSQLALIQNGRLQFVFDDFQDPKEAINSLLWDSGLPQRSDKLEDSLAILQAEDSKRPTNMDKAVLVLLDYTPDEIMRDIRKQVVAVTPNVAVLAIAEHYPINDRQLVEITHDYRRVLYLKEYRFLNKLYYKTLPWLMDTICYQDQPVIEVVESTSNPGYGNGGEEVPEDAGDKYPGSSDTSEYCCYWAQLGECETNPKFMRVNCQKSCGTPGCIESRANECQVDLNTYGCPWIRENGEIIRRKAAPTNAIQQAPVDTYAPVTPLADPVQPVNQYTKPIEVIETKPPVEIVNEIPVGADSSEYCCYWASLNECHTNPKFMRVNCQKSCGTPGCTEKTARACKVNLNIAGCKWGNTKTDPDNVGGQGNEVVDEEKQPEEAFDPHEDIEGDDNDIELDDPPVFSASLDDQIVQAEPVPDPVRPVNPDAKPIEITDVKPRIEIRDGKIVFLGKDDAVQSNVTAGKNASEPNEPPEWLKKLTSGTAGLVDKYPNAVDQNDFCCYWAQIGVCEDNPAMRVVCQKSCGTPGCFESQADECVVHRNIYNCPWSQDPNSSQN